MGDTIQAGNSFFLSPSFRLSICLSTYLAKFSIHPSIRLSQNSISSSSAYRSVPPTPQTFVLNTTSAGASLSSCLRHLVSHSSTRPKRKRIKKNLLSLERKKKEGKKVIGSVVFLVVYQGYYRFRRLDADVRCDIFFFVLSTSNRRRGRYIACPAGVGNFFFFFPLFFFPLLFFMVCYHGHFLPHICTMHARGRKTKLCGMLLTAFLPPPPLLTDSLIGHRTLVAGLPDSGVQVCPARACLQYCT